MDLILAVLAILAHAKNSHDLPELQRGFKVFDLCSYELKSAFRTPHFFDLQGDDDVISSESAG